MNNKFIKGLIVVNGVLFFFVLIYAIYNIVKEILPRDNHYERGLYVGEELEEAKKKEVALQGLKYRNPIELYNSKNYYLPISILTYKEEKQLKKTVSLANDIGDPLMKYVNVVFLDENYQVINSLLNKKASISRIEPQRERYYNYSDRDKIDETVKYIGYLIAFEDTNNDGKLNFADNEDLYISDLSGKNLTKVTNNIDVKSFDYKKSNTQIFIKYTERNELKKEHKKNKFAIYDIKIAKFLNISSIDKELEKLEKIIIE